MVNLNSSFHSISRILFGQEVGDLEAFRPYLLSMVRKPIVMQSALSNKDVHFSLPHFSRHASFIGLDELDFARKAPVLDINSLKDIDSICSALKEQSYCGNKLYGQCQNVRSSDMCTDCVDVLESAQMLQDKQAAYSFAIRKGDGVFGCFHCGEVAAAMRSMGCFFSKRLFESYLCTNSSDLAFSFNCRSDGMPWTTSSFTDTHRQ